MAEGGVPLFGLCRAYGISNPSFYKGRAKYGCMDALMIAQTKAMKGKNRQLRKMVAELVGVTMANAAQAAERDKPDALAVPEAPNMT